MRCLSLSAHTSFFILVGLVSSSRANAAESEALVACDPPVRSVRKVTPTHCIQETKAQWVPQACFNHIATVLERIDQDMFENNEDEYADIISFVSEQAGQQNIAFKNYASPTDGALSVYSYDNEMGTSAATYSSDVAFNVADNEIKGVTISPSVNNQCDKTSLPQTTDLAFQLILYIQGRALAFCHELRNLRP